MKNKITFSGTLFINMLFIPVIFIMIMLNGESAAQPAINRTTYNTAVGFRLGATSGLSVKHFIRGGNAAIDGIIGVWPDAISLTCLYEMHARSGVEGLNWYYGGGGHVFFEAGNKWYYDRDRYYYRGYYSNGGAGIGVDGVIGLEYKIRPVPFALSFDLKPFLESNTNGGIYFSVDPGFGVKFTF